MGRQKGEPQAMRQGVEGQGNPTYKPFAINIATIENLEVHLIWDAKIFSQGLQITGPKGGAPPIPFKGWDILNMGRLHIHDFVLLSHWKDGWGSREGN